MKNFRRKRVVVMGVGLHGGGVAAVRWFRRRGAFVTATDLRPAAVLRPSLALLKQYKRVTFVLGKHRHRDFRSASLVVQNPAVPNDSPYLRTARRAGVPIVNDLTVFLQAFPGVCIGVTGTKGKTTVATLIAHLLRAQFGKRVLLGGNIPNGSLWDALDAVQPTTIPVLELSSWQLEGLKKIQKSPHVAVVTNLLDDHLNRYVSRHSYFAAKSLVWRFQKKGDVAIFNRDDRECRAWATALQGSALWFSLRSMKHDGAYFHRDCFWMREGGIATRVAKRAAFSLKGQHNVANALAAIAVARYFHVPVRSIKKALKTYKGVSGRLERIRRVRGVSFWNDTTATAPAATIAALHSFSQKPICIVGGTDKGLPYVELGAALTKRAKRIILLPGSATEKLKKCIRKPYIEVQSMAEAVQLALTHAQRGDDVVLSPGAASFGLFLHEFDRGEAFLRAVRAL